MNSHRGGGGWHVGQNCVVRFVQLFSSLMKATTKGKGKTKEVRFDPIFFAASVPARKLTAKDLKDVEEHKNDPIAAATRIRRGESPTRRAVASRVGGSLVTDHRLAASAALPSLVPP